MAGANASLAAAGKAPFVLDRSDAFAGVMIDDLTTLGIREPYRMFTSRAEFRLSVRAENADVRLTRRGFELGLVSRARYENAQERERLIASGLSVLSSFTLPCAKWVELGYKVAEDGRPRSGSEILAMPHVTLAQVAGTLREQQQLQWEKRREEREVLQGEMGTLQERQDVFQERLPQDDKDFLQALTEITSTPIAPAPGSEPPVHPRVAEHVEVAVKYAGYLERQAREVAEFKAGAGTPIPPDIEYADLPGLSREEQEILTVHRPPTVHAASRIPGVRPSTQLMLFQVAKRAADAARRAATHAERSAATHAALAQVRAQADALKAEAHALAIERERDGSLPAGAA